MNKRRLLKLAKHLESGKLAHRIFDFGSFNTCDGTEKTGWCGSRGCALGECPRVFPKYWYWGKPCTFFLGIYGDAETAPSILAAKFFDISVLDSDFLFIVGPPGKSREKLGRKTIAKHIRDFVQHGGVYYDYTEDCDE